MTADAMATQAKSAPLDLNSVFGSAVSQFKGLNTSEPGQWPLLPKIGTWLVVAAILVVAGWFLLLSDTDAKLEAERAKEPTLKTDYRSKLAQAVNLEELRKQKLQVEEYVRNSCQARLRWMRSCLTSTKRVWAAACSLSYFGPAKWW
jgi:type IV pilus assembly protein PilO